MRVQAPTVGCSSLIPDGWRDRVPSAALPPEDATPSDWRVFGVQQTGQLVLSNDRTQNVVKVVESCEARDLIAARQIERPWFKRLWPG